MLAGMLAVAAGIAGATRLHELPEVATLVAALPLLVSLLACDMRALRVAGCVLLGFGWGVLRGHEMLARTLPPELEGRDLAVRLCVTGLPERVVDARGERWRARARVLDPLPGARGALAAWQGRRVEITRYGAGELRPAEAWSVTVRLRAPRGFANPGGRDYQAWQLSEGIDASGYVVHKAPQARLEDARCRAPLGQLRLAVRERLAGLVGSHARFGALLAVTIGDDSLFSPRDWELFARTGTTHLMVISGMHITLVAMLALLVARRALRRLPRICAHWPAQSIAWWIAAPAALLYGGLAGWSVSVQRALLMLAAVFVFGVLERRLRAWLGFALALLLVLALQPMAAMQTGFWLSFLAVAALVFVFGGRVAQPSRTQLAWQPQVVVAVGLAVPLMLAGQPQALLAPLVNIMAIPIVDLAVVPTALLGCLLLPLGEWPARLLLGIALFALDVLWWLLEHAARVSPGFTGSAAGHAPWRIVLAVLGTLWLLLPRGVPARHAGALLLLPMLAPAPAARGLLDVLALDVGQGTAVIVATRAHTLVYDSGARFSERFDAGRAIVAPALAAIGARRIDLLVISHADADHAGGAPGLAAALPVRAAIGGEAVPGLALARCARGMRWTWDEVEFEFLHPGADSFPRRGNDRSCVLRITAAGRRVLLAGDIEQGAESALLGLDPAVLAADVLLVPHHGSRTSSTERFVAAVSPRIALVSAGYRNRFGHPHPLVVQRYARHGSRVLNTAESGAIGIGVGPDGSLSQAREWREVARRYWFAPAGEDPLRAPGRSPAEQR